MGGGGRFLLKIPGGGVSRRGGAEGAGRVSAANWGFGGGGGGLNIFFRGRNVHQDQLLLKKRDARLKIEIGKNFGNKTLPPLLCS